MRISNLATSCLLTVSLSALAGGAYGQSAANQPIEKEVERVVVTATGRQAAIQDVPIALTAVTAVQIQQAGITDVRNLQQVTPSYRVGTGQSNSAGTSIAIRGIGTAADNPGFEAAVGVFIDGVFRNRSGVALSELPQIERIEVLRGPQGTLFGRNTSAGAVSVSTAAPKFERNTYGQLEAGDHGWGKATIGMTGPVSEHLALRLEASGNTRDGFITDKNSGKKINDRNRWFVRGQALWEINDDASIRFIADTSKTDENCCTGVFAATGSTAGAINVAAALRGLSGIPTINPESRTGAYTPGRGYGEAVEESGISAELNWNLKIGKLSYITSARDWETTRNQDIDFASIDRAYRDGFKLGFKTITNEIRLNGVNGRVDWLVGAFHSSEDANYKDTVQFGADAGRFVDLLASGQAAAFGIPAQFCNPAAGVFTLCPSVYRSLPGQSAATPQLFTAILANTPALAGLAPFAAAYGNAWAASAPVSGDGQIDERTKTKSTSFSVFTHNQIKLTDTTVLTLGLRYNQEEKDLTADLNSRASSCAVFQNTTNLGGGVSFNFISNTLLNANPALAAFYIFGCNPVVNTVANGKYADTKKEDAVSGTVSLKHDFTRDMMVYGTFARGYKAGGYNMDRSAFNITPTTTVKPSISDWRFKPEFVDNYELGWKFSNLPGRTTLNGAIFYQDITDYQINAFTGFNFRASNAPTVISKGVELDLVSRPISGLTLNGGLLYADTYYDEAVTIQTAKIFAGDKLAGASEWTWTGAVNYRQPISGTPLGWSVYLDGRYQSEFRTQTFSNAAIANQKGFALFNARVGIGAIDSSWGVDLWVKNLTDEFYKVGSFTVPEQDNTAFYTGDPRTMGVTLRANF